MFKLILLVSLYSSSLYAQISHVSSSQPIEASKINEVIDSANASQARPVPYTKAEIDSSLSGINTAVAGKVSGSVAGQSIRTVNYCFSHGVIGGLSNQIFSGISLGATYASPPTVSLANVTVCHGCAELIPMINGVSNTTFNVYYKSLIGGNWPAGTGCWNFLVVGKLQ